MGSWAGVGTKVGGVGVVSEGRQSKCNNSVLPPTVHVYEFWCIWCAAGCRIPKKIDSMSGKGVTRVLCGSQFSIAVTRDGHVYTW